VSAAPDVNKLADAMQTLVTAINSTISDINAKSSHGTAGRGAGPLDTDPLARNLRTQLLSGVSAGMDMGVGNPAASFGPLGVQLDRNGTLTFNKEKFLAAYQADPAKTQADVSSGFAKTFETLAKDATDPTKGRITQAIQGVETSVRRMNTEIFSWDSRLAAKKAGLQRKYAGLESALGKMRDQSSWLAGQLAGLSK